MRKYFCVLVIVVLSSFFSPVGRAQWVQVSQFNGSVTVPFLSVLAQGDTILAAPAQDSGLYRSSDAGVSWAKIPAIVGFYHIGCLYNYNGFIFAGGDSGIFRSSDFGLTWESLSNGLDPPYSSTIRSFIAAGGYLFLASGAGIAYSPDDGSTWAYVLNLEPGSVSSFVMNNGILYAATGTGVIMSDNLGFSWMRVNNGLPAQTGGSTQPVTFLFEYAGTVFAGIPGYGIYATTDQGATWSRRNSGFPHYPFSPHLAQVYSMGSRGGTLYADVALNSIYTSTNSGSTWTKDANPWTAGKVSMFTTNGEKLYAAADGGLYISSGNNVPWNSLNVTAGEFMSPHKIHRSGGVLNIETQYLMYSSDKGQSWNNAMADGAPFFSGGWDFTYAENDNYLFGSYNGIFCRSTDEGRNWQRDLSVIMDYINVLYTDGAKLFLGTGWLLPPQFYYGGLFISTDDGRTWNYAGLQYYNVLDIVKGGEYYFAVAQDGIYRSSKDSLIWTKVKSDGQIFSIVSVDSVIVVNALPYPYRSTDWGNTWLPANTGFPAESLNYYRLYRLSSIDHRLYIGTLRSGAFTSTDYGEHWLPFSDGLPTPAPSVRSFTTLGSDLYIATSSGVWKRPLPESSAVFNYTAREGWRMISFPAALADSQKKYFKQTVGSQRFSYDHGYHRDDSLLTGIGYWSKSIEEKSIWLKGNEVITDTIDVREGWNMIGSVAYPLPVSMLQSIPDGMTISPLYAYDPVNGYTIVSRLNPWKGYWVKASEAGRLIFPNSAISKTAGHAVHIVATNDLPPAPPFSVVASAPAAVVPYAYRLCQNYPNPFNPTTTFQYEVSKASIVSIKIYDVLGRDVAVLVNGEVSPGTYNATWNAANIAGGVYYVSMTASDESGKQMFFDVRKVVLIK